MNILPLRPEGAAVTLSAIVPVVSRYDEPEAVYRAYRSALARTGHVFEIIYVLDAAFPAMEACLRALQVQGEPVSIISLTQPFGEAVSLHVGAQRAQGDLLLMLPPYLQIEPEALPAVIEALGHADLVAACRDRHGDHWLNRVRQWGLNRIASVSGTHLRDLGCLVRGFHRRVLDDIMLQDEHHRFLPVLAQQAGYVVEQITLPQAKADRRFRLHRPSIYMGRLLDLVAIAFLLRFIQRPFRFFGTVGFVMAAAGVVLGVTLVVQKLTYDMALAERPALLLAALLVVLGIQIGAVGLIAEIIIFTRAGRNATYHVDRIVQQKAPAPREAASAQPPGR